MRSLIAPMTIAALFVAIASSIASAGDGGPRSPRGPAVPPGPCGKYGYYDQAEAAAYYYRRTPYTFYAESFVPLWLPPFPQTVNRPWVIDVLTWLRVADQRLDWNLAHCVITVPEYARLKNDVARLRVQTLGNAQIYQGNIPALQWITLRHNLRRLQRML